MTRPLSEPSKELAAKLLREVDYEEQLVGVRLNPMAGATEYPLYTFEGAVNFLRADSLERLLAPSTRVSIGYIDLNVLKRWIEEVFGDRELAEAIGEEISRFDNYLERVAPVKELLEQRLNQCRAVVEGAKEPAASEPAG